MEELRALPIVALSSGSDSAKEDGVNYARAWTVASGPSVSSRSIDVTVQWTAGRPHKVSLRTIVAP